jgi:hypothetical protein
MGIFGNVSSLFRGLGNPMQQTLERVQPGVKEALDREEMIAGNPFKGVGDALTLAGGGDPNGGMLQQLGIGAGSGQRYDNPEEETDPNMSKGLFRQFGGYREYGGPVRKKRAYVVGENGPEIFVPEDDGAIEPNPIQAESYTPDDRITMRGPAIAPQPVAPPPTMRRQMGPASMDDMIADDRAADESYAASMIPSAGNGTGSAPNAGMRPRVVDNGGVAAPPPMGGNKGLLRNGSIGGRQSDSIYRDVQGIDTRIAQTQKGQDIDPVTGEKPREHSFWKRFGKGFINSAKNADPKGGLAGMLFEGIGGAVNSGASPQAHQVSQLRGDKNKLLRTLGQQQDYEMADAKIDAAESVADENYAQIQHGQVAQQLAISKAEADRRRQIIEDARAARKEEREDRKESREERESQAKYDAGGNKEVVDIKQRNAEKRTKAAETRTKEKNEQARLRISGQKKLDAADTLIKLAAETVDLDKRGDLYKESIKLRTEGNDLMEQGNNFAFTPEPTYEDEKSVKTPNLATGSVTESAFRAKLQARGISDEAQMKKLIAQARADGVIR